MTADPDDNPFARESPWPRLPSAGAFKVGPLPKSSEPPPPLPEQTQRITPVFIRPSSDGAPLTPLLRGPAAAPRTAPARLQPFEAGQPQMPPLRAAQPAPRPAEPERVAAVRPIARPEPQPAGVESPSEPVMVVAAPVAGGKTRRKRSNLPLIAAGLAAAVGVAGLIAVTSGLVGGPKPPAPTPSVASASAPAAAATPDIQPTLPPAEAAAAPAPAPKALAAARAPRTGPRIPAIGFDEPIVPQSLPGRGPLPVVEAAPRPAEPLPTVEAAPQPPTAPAFQAPPPPDPNAPVTTKPPY